MDLMVIDLGSDTVWIKGTKLEVEDHWIHLTGRLVYMGIIIVPHLGDITIVITIIIPIGGPMSIFLRSSINSSLLHLMER